MDVLVCEAPLDSSFQKDKLVLVNKGSLGKRRKPTRANIKNLLSPSNVPEPDRETKREPSSHVPVSAACCGTPKVNGHIRNERTILPLKPALKIESSLPRTLPNHVADAHQFTIEAKLKRKKSNEVGRSAVLIQTWERRTWSNSLTRHKEAAKDKHGNRFQNKENLGNMPEPRTSGRTPQNGESCNYKGGLRVRDDTMLYRMPESGRRSIKQLNMNGNKPVSQEPEWISLSKKLCAKFVEGYIEPNSADSYLHEEPDGVMKQPPRPVSQNRPQSNSPKQTIPQRVEKPKKVVEMTPAQTPTPETTQPPWIDLSRKLCTKFIEEHIEYPVVPSEKSVQKALAVEPNGDVRIIEKVGKPKERKSKSRKDSEPEWISISKKLRAKFIESHIDDPDTISMDNQLNASDPELSSESLSDTYQEEVIPHRVNSSSNNTKCNGNVKYIDFPQKCNGKVEAAVPHQNNSHSQNHRYIAFQDKECCWEYQEMEFDQESNSGTFQEAEFSEDSITDCKKTPGAGPNRAAYVPKDIGNQKSDIQENQTFTSFAETANSQKYSNAECYNNDVHFAPHEETAEKAPRYHSRSDKITIKIVPHREPVGNLKKNGNSPEKNNGNSTFFNLTTWDEAHCKSPTKFKQELRSMSMNNICGCNDDCSRHQEQCSRKQKTNVMTQMDNHLSPESKVIYKSEDVLDKLECRISTRNNMGSSQLQSKSGSCEVFESNLHKASVGQFSRSSQSLEASGNLVSVNGVSTRTSSSDSFESFEIGPEPSEKNAESLSKSGSNNKPKIRQINSSECIKERECKSETSNGQQMTRSSEHLKDDESDSSVNYNEQKTKRMDMEDFDSIENSISSSYRFLQSIENEPNCSKMIENGLEKYRCENKQKIVRPKKLNEPVHDISTKSLTNDTKRNRSQIIESNENRISINKIEDSNIVLERKSDNRDSNNISERIYEETEDYNFSRKSSKDTRNMKSNANEKQSCELQLSTEDKHLTNATNVQKPTGMKKHYKCNGAIPTAKETKTNAYSQVNKVKKEKKITNNSGYENPSNSKDIRESLPNKLIVNEYANISSSITERKPNDNSAIKLEGKYKSAQSVYSEISDCEEIGDLNSIRNTSGEYYNEPNDKTPKSNGSSYNGNSDTPISSLKVRSHSMYDISKKENIYNHSEDENSEIMETKMNGSSNGIVRKKNISGMTFQEFASESDIPLCAKLVSKHNGKLPARSVSSSSNRNPSPCSETSHVYEDMFKETPSCPSDSETSSWTAMKNNSYYINGRSSSMNDLDMSDSCSMSVKCDYASSGSEQSTLQSRHSSVTSSSFYVNLRDYDSHMLEPSLNKKKKDTKKAGNCKKLTSSNPPTPESLRHLFTSPFHPIQSSANRISKSMNRLPQESDSHYYSSAAAASSAFKHGFDPTPPKQKKTERSSSVKIKDIAQGIILTFRRFQNHSKSSNVSPNHYVDVSHLAESNHTESGKHLSKKEQKEILKKQQEEKKRWKFSSENNRTDSDSGCHLSPSDVNGPKAKRSSSDLTGKRPKQEIFNADIIKSQNDNSDKKKNKVGKKSSNAREKGKKARSKSIEPRPISTVSRKVQQMPDGTLYLVTTVSGDTALPGVYSDSPDSSSELSSHRPVKLAGESNC